MTEIKWIPFSESFPSTDTQRVYVTDFSKVWIEQKPWRSASWGYDQNHLQNCAWAEIPMPEVPKQECAYCDYCKQEIKNA